MTFQVSYFSSFFFFFFSNRSCIDTKYVLFNVTVTFGGMASLFLGCSLVSLVEIIYVVYKSLVMLKHKYTKVNTVSGKQRLVLRRRHHAYRFCRPLYKPPEVDDISKKISSRREILRKYWISLEYGSRAAFEEATKKFFFFFFLFGEGIETFWSSIASKTSVYDYVCVNDGYNCKKNRLD